MGELIHLKKSLPGLQLMIELTQAPSLADLHHYVALYHTYQIPLSLDDVGTDNPWYPRLIDVLPFFDAIKFAMQNFRALPQSVPFRNSLTGWQEIAQRYQLDLTLEGVETIADEHLAQQRQIATVQGYLYDCPPAYTSGTSQN